MIDISASIVLYKNNIDEIKKVIFSFFSDYNLSLKLFLVDNSDTNELQILQDIDPRIEYIFNNKNLGFGKAHNTLLNKIKTISKYHLILNPDIWFIKGTLKSCYQYLETRNDVQLLNPKIFYPNGDLQPYCRLLPTPFDLILRRFFPSFLINLFRKRYDNYLLNQFDYNNELNIANLAGSFIFIRTKTFCMIDGFDERFFMYLEDVDLVRRVNEIGKTMFVPSISIYHNLERGSYKNIRLLLYHISSAIKYFNKWGWFFDKKRKVINKNILISLSNNNEKKV